MVGGNIAKQIWYEWCRGMNKLLSLSNLNEGFMLLLYQHSYTVFDVTIRQSGFHTYCRVV